ncbi:MULTISPECIES: hypothetical protein [unclassified Rhizobium]|uniref:hypothetical protein n=1 Tax=unclassified Rhizobium TaxID=2613769 RepID=UPI00160DCB72|nr:MULTISPECIES: hypothetical protein [unclassified Rhizobium]MBB3320248.1 hypothetical protein [Rhizobium sp. BK181]MCS3742694.1 hypothetical protein [Rhizobium sp. BK661]MCS4096004.1 hypothetical protein [Rhizobium sp. BK176]
MKGLGFSEAEIMGGLIKLAHNKVIQLLPGSRLVVLKPASVHSKGYGRQPDRQRPETFLAATSRATDPL